MVKRIFITNVSNAIFLQMGENSSYIILGYNFKYHSDCLQWLRTSTSSVIRTGVTFVVRRGFIWISIKVIMRANHAPISMSLLSIFRSGSFMKRTDPFLEHMPLSRTNCSTFLFRHHELRRDRFYFRWRRPFDLTLLHSMHDSPIRCFRWYYLWNESFIITLNGWLVKSGYDTQSNEFVFRSFPTLLYPSSGQELRLWFRRPFCLALTQVFILLVITFNV